MLKRFRMWSICMLLAAVPAVVAASCGGCGGHARADEPQPTPLLKRVPKPHPSCLTMYHGTHICSATVIATANGKSLGVLCNHCYGSVDPVTGRYKRGAYPVKCSVEQKATGKKCNATAVDGDPVADIAIIVIDGEIPAVPLAVDPPKPGTAVNHWGYCSKYTRGKVTRATVLEPPNQWKSFASSCGSCPGDSGAGILSADGLVAVNWGYMSGDRQSGTLACYVLELVRDSSALTSAAPQLQELVTGGDTADDDAIRPPTVPGPGKPAAPPPTPRPEPKRVQPGCPLCDPKRIGMPG